MKYCIIKSSDNPDNKPQQVESTQRIKLQKQHHCVISTISSMSNPDLTLNVMLAMRSLPGLNQGSCNHYKVRVLHPNECDTVRWTDNYSWWYYWQDERLVVIPCFRLRGCGSQLSVVPKENIWQNHLVQIEWQKRYDGSVGVSVYLSVHPFIHPTIYLLFYLSIYPSVRSSVSCLCNQMSELLWNRSWWPSQSY